MRPKTHPWWTCGGLLGGGQVNWKTYYTSSNWNVLEHSKITWHLLQLLLVWSAKHLLGRPFCLLLLILFHLLDPWLQSHGFRPKGTEPNWIRLAGTKLGETPTTSGRIKNHTIQMILNGLHWYFFQNLVLKSMQPLPRDTLAFPWRMTWRLKWKRTFRFDINSQTLRWGVLNVALPQGYIDLKTKKQKNNLPCPGPFELTSKKYFPYVFWGSSVAQNPDPWSLQNQCTDAQRLHRNVKSQCSPSQRLHRNFWFST